MNSDGYSFLHVYIRVLIQTTFEANFPLTALVPNTEKWQHHLDSFWDGTKPRDALQDHPERARPGTGIPGLTAAPSNNSCAGQFWAQDVTATGRWSERSPHRNFSARSYTNRLCRIRKQLHKQLGSYEPKGRKKNTEKIIMSVKEMNNLILQGRKAPQILDSCPLLTTGW